MDALEHWHLREAAGQPVLHMLASLAMLPWMLCTRHLSVRDAMQQACFETSACTWMRHALVSPRGAFAV